MSRKVAPIYLMDSYFSKEAMFFCVFISRYGCIGRAKMLVAKTSETGSETCGRSANGTRTSRTSGISR